MKLRAPEVNDAAEIWALVNDSAVLDRNSAYLYLVLCRDFADTCLVAVVDGEIIGFVTGYRPPSDPRVLFVWQIAVDQRMRGRGVAHRLLMELVRSQSELSFVEATIAPTNATSRRLFQSLARELKAPFEDRPDDGFREDEFPSPDHEAEPRIRIGPLTTTGRSVNHAPIAVRK